MWFQCTRDLLHVVRLKQASRTNSSVNVLHARIYIIEILSVITALVHPFLFNKQFDVKTNTLLRITQLIR